MQKKLLAFTKSLLKPLLVLCLVVTLFVGQADAAFAARGGRIGGGGFSRMPSRSYSSPTRTYSAPRGYAPGGGIGFPFLIPLFGFGGGFGGLFTVLLFVSIASFVVRSFNRVSDPDAVGYDNDYASPTISVARLQVGLLAEARSLQADLNRIALTANTGSAEGLTQVLQETSLSLLRHPEYWIYGGSESVQTRLESAEAQFNRLALTERSKFTGESLSNVKSQLKQAPVAEALPAAGGDLANLDSQGPGEYIVVTLLVATQGKVQLPAINSSDDFSRALAQLGAISSDRLMALEVLWTPQPEGDTLSAIDVLTQYPDLKLI